MKQFYQLTFCIVLLEQWNRQRLLFTFSFVGKVIAGNEFFFVGNEVHIAGNEMQRKKYYSRVL
jgi:hypothetical protein